MQKINVPILGVTDGSEARAVRDGECSVLHNLTVDKGGTRVIAPPTVASATNVKDYNEYYHTKAEQWLSVENGSVYNSKRVRINEIAGVVDGKVQSLSFMGNLAVMYCVDGTVRYAIYDGNYRYLGRLPELPKLNISIRPIHSTTVTENKYYADSAELSAADEGLKWSNVSKGFYDECLNALYQQGAFVDRTLVRIAARLFDGSYIAYSPIYYVEDIEGLITVAIYPWQGKTVGIGRDNMNFISLPKEGGTRSKYFASVRGFIPTFAPEKCDMGRWRDVIVGFDLFATPSIMGHESGNSGLQKEKKYEDVYTPVVELTTTDNYERYIAKSGSKIREEIANATLFYRIAEYDIDWKETWRLETTSPSQLAVQKRLPVNETPHELSGISQMYLYNGKLHLAGVQERFCDAYENFKFAGRGWESVAQISVVVSIETDYGKKCVVKNVTTPQLVKQGDEYFMPPLLHYPDARAKSIKLYVAYLNKWNSSVIVSKEFPLTAHSALNEAYFLNESTEGNSYETTVTKEVTEMEQTFEVVIEQNGRDNDFVSALKLKYDEREDFSGVYTFTYTAENSVWTMNVAFADSTTIEESVLLQQLGIKLFIGGEEVTEWDYIFGNLTALKGGEKIIVTLKKDAGSFVGIKPIKIDGDGWSPVASTEVDTEIDERGNIVSFILKEITDDRLLTRRNIMRLSAVDNPLFFPAKSTYSFDADILAVYSNTVAVSQGQFGQHPLYVFTGNGVWLMGVDASGAGSYTTQVPCSREICNNGKGVTTTMQGVVFPTSMGLMLVNGAQAVNISADIAGLDTPELRKSGDAMERICGIVGKESIRNRVTFTEYLQNAFVAFDHNTNLLYVCNGKYDYVYVYNMTSGAWSTADGRYTELVKHTEKLMLRSVYHDGQGWQNIRYCFDNYDREVDDVPVVMITRGCLFGSTGFKRMGRCALRATFFSNKMGLYLLGSRDGVTWKAVSGKECTAPLTRAAPPTDNRRIVRDLICRSLSSRAYKYFAFAFAGTARSDAKFAIIECEVESDYKRIM